MKLRGLGLIMGVAIIVGLGAVSMTNSGARDERRRVEAACLNVGEVAQDCDRVMPGVPRCTVEDCSDITGLVGYWRDPVDGRLWLVKAPWTRSTDQSPAV
jgi:hypothetical protein